MILRIFISYAGWFLVVSALFARTPAPPGKRFSSLQLSVTHMMGAQPLVRKDVRYTNPSGEVFTISRFRYFLSNFSLENTDGGTITLPPAYFLVDDAIDSSKTIRLDSVPAGQYKSIRFLVGVDSARNVSGVQSGALAVETGMFWTWNSGYIMAQLEGHSDAIAAPMHEFLFHTGGYKAANGILKYVTLPFPQPLTVAEQPRQINMTADAGKWFAPDTISFKQVSVVMAPGLNARKLAANYQHMFTITSTSH